MVARTLLGRLTVETILADRRCSLHDADLSFACRLAIHRTYHHHRHDHDGSGERGSSGECRLRGDAAGTSAACGMDSAGVGAAFGVYTRSAS